MTPDPSTAGLTPARESLFAGDAAGAIQRLRDLIALNPADTEPRYWLASALAAAGEGAAASAALEEARMLQALMLAKSMGADLARLGRDGDYAADIATRLYRADHVAAASVVFGRAIAAGHASQNGLITYALSLQHQGRAEEAIRIFRATLEMFPSAVVHQFMLYPHCMVDSGPARYAREARVWAERWAPEIGEPTFANRPGAGRKLRIGYVAPTFAGSQIRQFITPILENHDPEAAEVLLYPARAETEAEWPDHIAIRPIGHLADADAAALIRADRVDVLVDCWGHTAGSRLAVFARRAAPVQAAWINFVQTTGLKRMDYVLHADGDASPGTLELFNEKIWPIGPVFNAFRPAGGRLPPAPTPALRTGRVTFGSFNHPAKLSDSTLDAWAGVLRGAPSSRLILKYRYFIDPVLQRATHARFAARGVAPERIFFSGHSSGEDYFRAFQEIDLMLDAWPAPGSTTTLEALSNGVPVLVKDTAGCGGLYVRSILEASGLPELIASSSEDFATRAVDLASDVARLDALRRRVRPGFDKGPCSDEVGFTRRVEAAFGEMFDVWFAQSQRRQAHG